MKYPSNRPITSQVWSGTYEVPAGKYAIVIADPFNGNFLINGQVAWSRDEAIDGASQSASVILTVPTNKHCKVNIFSLGGAVIRYKSNSNYDETLVAGSFERILSSGDQVIGPASISGKYLSNKGKTPVFYVPEGTQLDGQNYTVSLYDKENE